MRVLACLAILSVAVAACSFHSETTVQKPPPKPAPVIVTDPPPGTVYVPARS